MTLRLNQEDTQMLRQRAERDGVSMQDVARTAVQEYLRHSDRKELLDNAIQDTLARYSDTLRRLGE